MRNKKPSDEDLKEEIAKILENADLASTSSKKVRQQLEESFGVDLGDKKKVIDELVMQYVNQQQEEDEEEEEDEDEEEEKKPARRAAKPAKKRKESTEEDEEDEEEEDEPPPKKRAAKKKKASSEDEDEESDEIDSDEERKKKKKAKGKGKKGAAGGRGKNSGYTKAYKLSPALADLMGAEEMPRHEVVKRVWAIIKERKLYDPNNKQFAICDDALYKVIGTKRFRCFGMMKYLKSHFVMA